MFELNNYCTMLINIVSPSYSPPLSSRKVIDWIHLAIQFSLISGRISKLFNVYGELLTPRSEGVGDCWGTPFTSGTHTCWHILSICPVYCSLLSVLSLTEELNAVHPLNSFDASFGAPFILWSNFTHFIVFCSLLSAIPGEGESLRANEMRGRKYPSPPAPSITAFCLRFPVLLCISRCFYNAPACYNLQ